jgi:FMN phosphatase YigB (HAD superfamily)
MKTKIFLDFDEVIVSAQKAFCEAYNELYNTYSQFTFADWTKNNEWDFTDVCPLLQGKKDVEKIFCTTTYFKYLNFIDENMPRVLTYLMDEYDLIICTIGWLENISKKSLWIRDNLPMIHKSIFMANTACHMNKSDINMANSIFVDDNMENLLSSNASMKICFGRKFNWNKDWNGLHAANSLDLLQLLGDYDV